MLAYLPTLVASIPSPDSNAIDIGPIRLTFYGLLVGTGVAVAWWLTVRRSQRAGLDPKAVEQVLLRMVVFGFLGARAAYVSTHTHRFEGDWWGVFAIWEGGLALFGGLTVGAITLVVASRRRGIDLRRLLDALAPAVPIAQAFGRWGNYVNQELFGTPSTLPWAVEIDPRHRPDAYLDAETFHPTFLYESLWNLALAGSILLLERRHPALRGRLVGIYFVGYGVIRFLLELMRTDTTFRFLGLSRNGWVSIGVVIIGIAVLAWRRHSDPTSVDEPVAPTETT